MEFDWINYLIWIIVSIKKRQILWRNMTWVEEKVKVKSSVIFHLCPQYPKDHGKGPFKRVWPIQQGKSQVKQLYKHYDFNNKISGIWLQPLNPMKHCRGQSFFLVCMLVLVWAYMPVRVCVYVCKYIHSCSSGFVSKCVIPWLVPELVCCLNVAFC